ncbi:MAG: TlpA disulfide reductase family protein [Acidimicrobiia bacterium]
MKRIPSRQILFTLIAGIAIVATACSSSSATETPGAVAAQDLEIAPSFSVPTSEGVFSLAEHIASDGRPIFLNLWASWCFPCREEMPAIDRIAKAFPGIMFIGISVKESSRSDAEDFAEEIGVTYLLGFDDDDEVDSAYRPFGLPASYIISSDGVILERIIGRVTEEDLANKFVEHFDL